MTIQETLAQKKVSNPKEKFSKELKKMTDLGLLGTFFSSVKLKKEVALLGIEFLRKSDTYGFEKVTLGSKRADKFKSMLFPAIWDNKEYYKLLVYFFGEQTAPLIRYIWERMPLKMYQHSYDRRSFRAPNNERFGLLNQVNFLIEALNHPTIYSYSEGNSYYNLTLLDQIRYDNDVSNNSCQFLIWSAAIDNGNKEVFELIEAIIMGNDSIGKVSRNSIKALLNSDKKECWQLVEKLLLAAQRQEGLRQTILEALDETSVGALQYMIGVIIEHKLSRFSSVVRAVDTWTGLGWESEKETTVRKVLTYANHFLENPETISKGMLSKDNQEVYMALWVQGVLDADKTKPMLHELLEKGSLEKKCLAIYFAKELGNPYIEMPLYFNVLATKDLQLLAFMLPNMLTLLEANKAGKFYIDNPDYPHFFEKLKVLIEEISIKEKTFEGKVFSWTKIKFSKEDLLKCWVALVGDKNERKEAVLTQFESLPISVREEITKDVLKDYFSYYYNDDKVKIDKPLTDFQREFALRIVKDRGEVMVSTGIRALRQLKLTSKEVSVFQELFKRKNVSLRGRLLNLTYLQSDVFIESLFLPIVTNGDAEQRIAALEMMVMLFQNNRMIQKVTEWKSKFEERNTVSDKEKSILAVLSPKIIEEIPNKENGYGFYDPTKISSFNLPKIDPIGLYSRSKKLNTYGFSKTQEQLKKDIVALRDIFISHQNYEYDYLNYNNEREKVLLGNTYHITIPYDEKLTATENYSKYPLHEVWQAWYEQVNWTPLDLYLMTFEKGCNDRWKKDLNSIVFYHLHFIPNPIKDGYYWNNPLIEILTSLQLKNPLEYKNQYLIERCSDFFANLPLKIIQYKYKKDSNTYYSSFREGDGWQSESDFSVFLNKIEVESLTDQQIEDVWMLYRWRQQNGLKENASLNQPPVYFYCWMFDRKKITEDEFYEGILTSERMNVLTSETKHYQHYQNENLRKIFPFITEYVDKITNRFIDYELSRGELNTEITEFVFQFKKIYGVKRLVQFIQALGKQSFSKGYYYYWSGNSISKQLLYSNAVKKCYPHSTDTPELFNTLVAEAKLSEKKLIEAAVYAPQWQSFVSQYLDWQGLDSAIWWMHAHSKTSAYESINSELESEVAKYSAVDIQDFKDGAVDKDWFDSAYKQLGKAKWELLYDASKFITDGNGHRRIRLYADTIIGDLKIREVTAKVKDKRDQDYLRVYGLVPLSKTNPKKDVLSRYEYIQQFKRESKEFGSMKQTSEALAIRVALENLARNAGYPDPMRLTWAMETEQINTILGQETNVSFEETTISLLIDSAGKAEVTAQKDGKVLKSIPDKYKKHADVIRLLSHRKVMREQFSRSRKSLEEAMIRGDWFTNEELKNLFKHPIISNHLEKLVFITSDKKVGFYDAGALVLSEREPALLIDNDHIRIAHCYDFYELKVWTSLQRFCFDQKMVQPFKQIFRELYVPTADELAQESVSRRYAGHQVHPKQTLALLKGRGWKVDYEEGLQKVFHKEGFQVKLYAMADWFSPADVESPTLESIEFVSLKEYKNVAFEKIPPRIFSEVMRDVDLVVSVAHVGGVDPEMSHSSIEMRSVLLKETLRLFKLANVEIKGNHAIIQGEMAKYSIHLGSAIAHQMPGKYLSILPVHSQHRGRLFLPFADDDPKTAELISKVLLLAKDTQIQDPTILSQIDRSLAN